MDAASLAETAEQLAHLGLQLLLRATANAAVQEALTDEALLRQLYWLCVQPPSGRVLNAALALLRRLSSSPLAASVGGYQGGAIMLMSVLLHSGRWVTVTVGPQGFFIFDCLLHCLLWCRHTAGPRSPGPPALHLNLCHTLMLVRALVGFDCYTFFCCCWFSGGRGLVVTRLLLHWLTRQTLPRLLLLTCWVHSWPSPATGRVCLC